jgi:hypothetical protein
VLLENDRLVISGGADALFLVDEVDAAGAARFVRAWTEERWDLLTGHPELLALRDRLMALGALLPAQPVLPSLEVALVFAGEPDDATTALLGEWGRPRGIVVGTRPESASLVLVCRTNGTLLRAVEVAPRERPHLLLDLAYHDSLSLGPLVFPGQTACLGCFTGRIGMAWGDPQPPPRPAALRARELMVAMVLVQLSELSRRGTCPALVERALALNLDTLETTSHRVHRLPWCPRCFPEATGWGAGSFRLPWT